MFCSKCGAEIAEGAAFCPKCGEAVANQPVNDVAGYQTVRSHLWDDVRRTKNTGFLGFLEYWVLMWANYANRKGRATRMEYWSVVLINLLISFILGRFSGALSTIYGLVVLIPTICVYCRRAHDFNKSGNFVALIYIFQIVGTILFYAGGAIALAYLMYGVFTAQYFYSIGVLAGSMVALVVGLIMLIISFIMTLYLGLKGSYNSDNEYGPYPHR